ncbi:MAG: alpha/beta hydrolase [Burkholderiales bacterium]|nr:alpha/beta hydrolase [Burkholderiales bacterium]
MPARYEVEPEWVHVEFAETTQFTEVYGFSGSQGMVNLEGVRFVPKARPSRTLVIFMHPATTLQLLPVPRALARRGVHVLCAGSRYARNDAPLVMEKVIVDLGAHIRHARRAWGYEKVVIDGWSGGGSLALLYQSQAENPTITATPAGDPIDIKAAGLVPADALLFHAAHRSRATTLADWLDPSVLDENDPDRRDPELDLYDPANPNQPPYSQAYLARYRAAQVERMRRRTAWVLETLATLRRRGGPELERGFVTHRTMADPRFLDPQVDPNGRKPRWSYLGDPGVANCAPAGIARFSTLRSWLSQWSLEHTRAHGPRCAASVAAPMLLIENSADDAVPQPDVGLIHAAAASRDKTMRVIRGATHYYQGQPELLEEAVAMSIDWMQARRLLE